MSKRNLVITGWYLPEYLAAAAAAYIGYHGDADVVGSSIARLPSVLERYGFNYKHIDILGVGLENNLERLGAVLARLAEQGITTRWISQRKFPMKPEVEIALAESGGGFSEVRVAMTDTLIEAVGEVIEDETDDLENAVNRLKPFATFDVLSPEQYAVRQKDDTPLTVQEIWPVVYQAAHFCSRDKGDDKVCGRVVQTLARNDCRDIRTLKCAYGAMINEYLMGYRGEMLGSSEATDELRELLKDVALADKANVMIFGETGVGKQVAAEFIHAHSIETRKKHLFAEMNCACAGDDDMLMDALFGHEDGAYTGAKGERKGIFEDANGGTVFLDEIATAGPKVQAMLLKVLDKKPIQRVGGCSDKEIHVDVRIICATNEDLQQMVIDGKFRHDLYERLCGIVVEIKPLYQRLEDIEPIANNQWRRLTGSSLKKEQIAQLMKYDYPGNVRELISIVNNAHFLKEEDFSKVIAAREKANARIINWRRRQRIVAAGEGADADVSGMIPCMVPMAAVAPVAKVTDELRKKLDALPVKERTKAEGFVKLYRDCGCDMKRVRKETNVNRNTMLKYLAMVEIDPVNHRGTV